MQHLTPDLHNVDPPSNHCAPALDYFSDEREAMYDFNRHANLPQVRQPPHFIQSGK